MHPKLRNVAAAVGVFAFGLACPAADTVATAVYSKVGNGYKRAKAKDGSFRPEYYALGNGGRIEGTTTDATVDRVTYPEVARIATKLLGEQNYHYAQTKEQARLLLVLQWGSTLAPNGAHTGMNVASAQSAKGAIGPAQAALVESLVQNPTSPGMTAAGAEQEAKNTLAGFGPSPTDPGYRNEHAVLAAAGVAFESQMLQTLADNRVRDQLNERNARILGYMDDLADSNDIRRWAGGGDRYQDLITEVEESRYYIVISAYDFPELLKTQKRKLLWQTRVSVRSPGNSFNDTYLAMLKSASPYFGRNSGKLVRNEEPKGTVELGEVKYLGTVENPPPATPSKEK